MSFLAFTAAQLRNLEFSLGKEFLVVNENGSYCSSSVTCCNTRKYHGLLVCPVAGEAHNRVLISALDETVAFGGESRQLAVHQYPGVFYPQGHKYLEHFELTNIPTWTYVLNDMVLTKSILLCGTNDIVIIKYSLSGNKPVQLTIDPFFACRGIHQLRHQSPNFNLSCEKAANTLVFETHDCPPVHFSFSKEVVVTDHERWYNNVEYRKEKERGYEFSEDLFVPVRIGITLHPGEDFYVAAGTAPILHNEIRRTFRREAEKRPDITDLESALESAAKQLVASKKTGPEVIAGWHWFGRWGRDTFIALPGLTLCRGNVGLFHEIAAALLKEMKGGLLPNAGSGPNITYNSADTSLWFIRSVQLMAAHTGDPASAWKLYGASMQSVLENYRKAVYFMQNATLLHFGMIPSGLISLAEGMEAMTWMDVVVDGKAVTPRAGCPVEINALWYNAICFCLEAARAAGDDTFVLRWQELPALIGRSFVSAFWSEERGYLADVVNGNRKDLSFRPNQLLACSLEYTPLTRPMRLSILKKVGEKLVTSRGLRTLAPDDPAYHGHYRGDAAMRDSSYHQGTVWPWLAGIYCEAMIRNFGDEAIGPVKDLYEHFGEALLEYGTGTIAEVYDGDEPHSAGGAISQAWSVAELIRIHHMLQQYSAYLAVEPEWGDSVLNFNRVLQQCAC